MKEYAINVLISIDQLFFTLVGGYPDETLSSALYRYKNKSKIWNMSYKAVNALFFWQDDHCQQSYESELLRKHLKENF